MKPVILCHGGAGQPNEDSDGCLQACRIGQAVLNAGGDDAALRAVVDATAHLEDDPRFNAGTGASLRLNGEIEQDAILATCDERIGALACLKSTRNPIRVAREVMRSPHAMLCGEGATSFARSRGFAAADCSTPKQIRRREKALERLRTDTLRPDEQLWKGFDPYGLIGPVVNEHAPKPAGMHGTVGAVARAADGTFAVACSTGGTTLMLPGRIGDTPIFGAGVMVGKAGAVCATGDGEEILRRLSSMRAYWRIEQGEHPQSVADELVAAFPADYIIGFIIVTRDAEGVAATRDVMACASSLQL